jgi:predicted DNA-binding transcriptional regulator YafY
VRRADRLFRIVQFLRGRRLTTAAQLAGWLKVSERTIYRDVADLSASGTPIEGEAGVGYRLRGSMDLPPLMFDFEEIEALTLGARFVEAWSSPELAAAAASASAKIAAALPADKRRWMDASRAFVPQLHLPPQLGERFEKLRAAIADRRIVRFVCPDKKGTLTEHRARPLSLAFWGEHWTLLAWSETKNAFESPRLDQMLRINVLTATFADEPGKRLTDYTARLPLQGRLRSS